MRKLSGLLLATLFVLCVPSLSQAIMIEIAPPVTTVQEGGSFDVSILVSGLEQDGNDEIVSAFDLFIDYDPTVIAANSVVFGSELGGILNGDFISPGQVEIFEISLFDDEFLAATQGDSVLLAVLTFDALAAGTSSLVFGQPLPFLPPVDVKGRDGAVLDLAVNTARVIVEPAAIPEPTSLALLGLGLFVMGALRRRPVVARHN